MPELHIYDVVRRPISSEKAEGLSAAKVYIFEVDKNANKYQVKAAIEQLFEVKVATVNTLMMPAKRGMRGRKAYIRRKAWKKAIVKLTADSKKIELFNV
jgi:large subunit ribosomal protein L23